MRRYRRGEESMNNEERFALADEITRLTAERDTWEKRARDYGWPDCGELAQMTDEIDLLRELLAKRISGANLYRDDGELQDNAIAPFIDFRRDSAKDIARKLEERAAKHFLCCGG